MNSFAILLLHSLLNDGFDDLFSPYKHVFVLCAAYLTVHVRARVCVCVCVCVCVWCVRVYVV